MSGIRIDKVRDDAQIATFSAMDWEFLRDNYCPPSGEAFIGTTDGFPDGICLLRKEDEGGGELDRMNVRPSARGVGMGRMLAQAVNEDACTGGLHTLRPGALYRHTEALPLYESLGFVRHFPGGELHAGDGRVVHMKLEF